MQKLFLFLSISLFSFSAFAQQKQVTLYCPTPGEWCKIVADDFEKATNIRVNVLRKSSGEVLAQVRAEKENPKGDIWWGGISDSHLAAAQEDLTLAYDSLTIATLAPCAKQMHAVTQKKSVGVLSLALGIGYNSELASKKGFVAPLCYSDLLRLEYKGEIQMPNPNTSGTAYQFIATLVQIMGEDAAFEYLKKLHVNINIYTRSGGAPATAAARGETGIALTYLQDVMVEIDAGYPLKMVTPCEGTARGIANMSLIKGAPNLENAKKLYEWLLSVEGQNTRIKAKQAHSPANLNAIQPTHSSALQNAKFIEYDYHTFGSTAKVAALLKRWDAEIGSLPR